MLNVCTCSCITTADYSDRAVLSRYNQQSWCTNMHGEQSRNSFETVVYVVDVKAIVGRGLLAYTYAIEHCA